MEGGKALDPSLQSFVSNGHKYTIVNSLSLARGIQFDEYVPQMKAGATIEMFYETLNEIWNCLNTLKLAEAAVKIDNLRRGIELRAYDNPAYLKICALYMCKEGEDTRAAVTDDLLNEKIDDWTIEGWAKESFLAHAVTFALGTRVN